MSFILLYILGIFLFFALASVGIILFLQHRKKKQYENQIKSLKRDLAAAKTQAGLEAEKFKTVQGASEYEKYAGLVITQMDRAVIIIDQNRVVRLMNEQAKKFLDFATEVGMSYKEVFHIRAAGEADNYALFEAAFAGKTQHLPDNSELVSQRGAFPVSGTILPLMTGQMVAAVIFMFEDNSKQAARVREEQAFFSAAAHELRTPLTIIRMTVSLLLEKFEILPREKIIEHLRRTDETSEHLVRLVNEFLDISRIDQGRLEIKAEKFDIVTLTDEVIDNLALLARERNLYVHHEINISERMVVADRTKAAEVLSNLIGNGLKYTIRGGVTITHAITGSTFATTITDTGSGISRESQGLLFKRFGQIKETHPLVPTKSTGLGLYISKKLAQLMRGDVALVKSEPGFGTTFAFTLPLGLMQGIS